eukprot:5205088-Pyramimonas_sp.AAC.1
MKARAGQGVDQLSPADMKRLPREGLLQLVQLFQACEARIAWPWQVLLVIGRLLGKKSGGDR